jgi:hypothetical protein
MGERREKFTRYWWESPKERDHLEDQGVGGKMGSEWILGRLAWGVVDWIILAQDRGCCECGDEPLGSCATELVSLSFVYTCFVYVGLYRQTCRTIYICTCRLYLYIYIYHSTLYRLSYYMKPHQYSLFC